MEDIQKYAAENQHNIELRSEKVRNIIGQIPPFLIRWGNTILFVILLLLLVTGYFLKFYSTLTD